MLRLGGEVAAGRLVVSLHVGRGTGDAGAGAGQQHRQGVEECWCALGRINRVSVVNGNLHYGKVVLGVSDSSYGSSYGAAGNEVGHYSLSANSSGGWQGALMMDLYAPES